MESPISLEEVEIAAKQLLATHGKEYLINEAKEIAKVIKVKYHSMYFAEAVAVGIQTGLEIAKNRNIKEIEPRLLKITSADSCCLKHRNSILESLLEFIKRQNALPINVSSEDTSDKPST